MTALLKDHDKSYVITALLNSLAFRFKMYLAKKPDSVSANLAPGSSPFPRWRPVNGSNLERHRVRDGGPGFDSSRTSEEFWILMHYCALEGSLLVATYLVSKNILVCQIIIPACCPPKASSWNFPALFFKRWSSIGLITLKSQVKRSGLPFSVWEVDPVGYSGFQVTVRYEGFFWVWNSTAHFVRPNWAFTSQNPKFTRHLPGLQACHTLLAKCLL